MLLTMGPTCLKTFICFSSVFNSSVTYGPLRLINCKARKKPVDLDFAPRSLPIVIYPERWNVSIELERVSVDCRRTCCTRTPTVSSHPDRDWIWDRAISWRDCCSMHLHRRQCVDSSSIDSAVPIGMNDCSSFETFCRVDLRLDLWIDALFASVQWSKRKVRNLAWAYWSLRRSS